jgi:5'-AMP-activated protein kinase catalytic alpha subunit
VKQELWFTSTQPPSSIISKLEEIAKVLRFKVKKSEDCKVKLQRSEQALKGHLSIDAEIFEVTPSLFVVELRKTGGDILEYNVVYCTVSTCMETQHQIEKVMHQMWTEL